MSDHAVSHYLQKHILEYLTDAVTYTRYLALLTAKPNANGTISEVSGSGYARANLYDSTVTDSVFPLYTGTSGYLANDRILSFAKNTGTWTTAYYWAIMTAVTGGNLLTWGQIIPGYLVPNNEYATFPVGTLIIRCPTA